MLDLRLKSCTPIIASGTGKVLFFRCASAIICSVDHSAIHAKKQQRRGPGKNPLRCRSICIFRFCIIGFQVTESRSELVRNILRRLISAMTAVKKSKRA